MSDIIEIDDTKYNKFKGQINMDITLSWEMIVPEGLTPDDVLELQVGISNYSEDFSTESMLEMLNTLEYLYEEDSTDDEGWSLPKHKLELYRKVVIECDREVETTYLSEPEQIKEGV